MADEAQPEDLRPTEEMRVFAWRMHQFMELGFTELQAELLADGDADLNVARSLVVEVRERGYPIRVAFDILL